MKKLRSTARTSAELLEGRRFADLTLKEKEVYRELREAEADARVSRIVDNLNRNAGSR